MRDGTVRERRIDRVKWSDSRPPSWQELVEKFESQVEPVLGSNGTRQVVDIIANIERDDNIDTLMELLNAN